MARLPRYYLPGHPQHVIVRGNNGCRIFHKPEDREYYLMLLKKAADKHACDIHAYALMENHVHLLITPHREQSIGKAIQMIGRYYVQYFNQAYERSGTLWEGRYKATLIDRENYLLTCTRYIELNPVRAGIVSDPADYPWTSYPSHALGKSTGVITDAPEYLSLGESSGSRQAAYRSLFEQQLSDKTVQRIRDATNKSWVLGEAEYKESIANLINRRTDPKPRGGDRRSQAYRAQRAQVQ